MRNEVLEEVRKAREAYGERFNFDLEAIFLDLNERERASGREVVSLSPKRIVPTVDVPLVDQVEAIPASDPSAVASQGS
jgi:hypothetical protein